MLELISEAEAVKCTPNPSEAILSHEMSIKPKTREKEQLKATLAARKTSAVFRLAASLVFLTSEKSPLFMAVTVCLDVGFVISFIIYKPP